MDWLWGDGCGEDGVLGAEADYPNLEVAWRMEMNYDACADEFQ